MILAIRNIEMALGNYEKKPSSSESLNIEAARKSIIARQIIKKGDLLTEENLIAKRPGNGISPMEWYNFVGTIASKNYEKDDLI
jgi:N,N'-diacetyllegionaminate synthase